MWESLDGHERIIFGNDPHSGLHAVIAIHSTALGPALGGTRMSAYNGSSAAALADALRLSKAMTYKNALAGLAHGGGKGVIFGDLSAKSPELLTAYGKLIASQNGDYITACDVGTYVEDMDVIAQVCPWTTGRSPEHGGAGDSGVLTAFGVWQGMRAAAQHRWGSADLTGRVVAIAGLGKVGRRLARHLADEGAVVIGQDVHAQAVERAIAEVPELTVVADSDELLDREMDIYSPNAMGGAIDDALAGSLRTEIICGGANNQLTHPGLADVLDDRGVLYAPDFMVNCGGVVQVADELHGFDFERAKATVARVFDTATTVFTAAAEAGITPVEAAEAEAERRIEAARGR